MKKKKRINEVNTVEQVGCFLCQMCLLPVCFFSSCLGVFSFFFFFSKHKILFDKYMDEGSSLSDAKQKMKVEVICLRNYKVYK